MRALIDEFCAWFFSRPFFLEYVEWTRVQPFWRWWFHFVGMVSVAVVTIRVLLFGFFGH
jgi:hypothetical protein